MIVNAAHGPLDLVEADIVEALKTGASDGRDTMIWDEKVFLPPHKYVLLLREILEVEIGLPRLLGQRLPCPELAPVRHVGFFGRTPRFVLRLECVFRADDLAFKVGGKGGVIFGQVCVQGQPARNNDTISEI